MRTMLVNTAFAMFLAAGFSVGCGETSTDDTNGRLALELAGAEATGDANHCDHAEEQAAGHKGHKVAICHIPPGNPANAHTILVGEKAVAAHLAHGDILGACGCDDDGGGDGDGGDGGTDPGDGDGGTDPGDGGGETCAPEDVCFSDVMCGDLAYCSGGCCVDVVL